MKVLAAALLYLCYVGTCRGFAPRSAKSRLHPWGGGRAASVTSTFAAGSGAGEGAPCKQQSLSLRHDNLLERCGIYILCVLLCTVCNDKSCWKEVGFSYRENFVPVAKRLLRQQGKSMQMVSVSILELLNRVLPSFVREFFRNNYAKNSKYICTASSQWFSFGFIEWLVGPAERFGVQVRVRDGDGSDQEQTWTSGVKLTECRFLAESQCKSACVHLCKAPTQALFQQSLGVPLYMKPNYDDCSCEFFFGIEPPPLASDPAVVGDCYSQCSVRRAGCVDG